MGVKVERLAPDTCRFQADEVDLDYLESPRVRGPGRRPARLGDDSGAAAGALRPCQLPKPGGDKIGRRPLDTHFLGLEKLGGKLTSKAPTSTASRPRASSKAPTCCWMRRR